MKRKLTLVLLFAIFTFGANAQNSVSCRSKAPLTKAMVDTCVNTPLILTATNQGSGTLYWFSSSTIPTTTSSLGTGDLYEITNSTPFLGTFYVYEYDASNACFGPATTIQVTVKTLPNIIISKSANKILKGESVDISVSGADAFNWDNNLGIVTNLTVSPTSSTIYSVTGTNSNGCSATAKTSLVVTQPNCVATTSLITASACGTYLLNDSTYSTSGNYTQTIFNAAGCDSVISLHLTINPLPTIAATANPAVICLGSSSTISASGGISNIWNNGLGSGTVKTVSPTYTCSYIVAGTDANGCINTAVTKVTVYGLPTVIWASTNPTLVCSDGAPFTLNVTVSPTGGIGTFGKLTGLTKMSETSASIDPIFYGAGIKTVSYTYTDLNGCINSVANSSINVYDTPEPIALSISTMSNPIPTSFGFGVSSQGLTKVEWYLNPKSIVLGTGNTFVPIIPHTGTTPDSLVAGSYNYLYTQTINGCESEPVSAQAYVTNCPSKAPIAGVDPKPCSAANLSNSIYATAQGAGTLVWFATASTASTHLGSGSNYVVNGNAPGNYTYYVAEYNAANSCYGPTTPVQLTINPLPNVSIIPLNQSICYTSGVQTLTLIPSGGTLTGTGVIAPNTFDPKVAGEVDGSYLLTYNYTDANGCSNIATVTMNVTFADAPVAVLRAPYLQDDILPMGTTIPEVCAAKGNGSGLGIEWANGNDIAFSSPLAGGTSLCYNSQEVAPASRIFYVRQTENGCKSDAIQVILNIFGCPWTAPITTNVVKCENDPTLATSELSASTTETGVTWQWNSDALAAITVANATSNIYNPGGNVPGNADYYVRYSKVEPSSGVACWSPLTKVSRTIYPKPAPVFDASVKNDYCSTTVSQINLKGSDSKALVGTDQFSVDGIVNQTATIPLSPLTFDKTFSILYVRTTDKNCKDSVTKSIIVHAPIITSISETINKGDSILIASQYRKTAGKFDILYNSQKGCDSTVHYIIIVKIIGDTNGDGIIGVGELPGDSNGDGVIGVGELAGDVNGDGKIGAGEIVGDLNGDGSIGTTEMAGDSNGNGVIGSGEIVGDKNGDGVIGNNELSGDKNGNGIVESTEIVGDKNGDGIIGTTEFAGDVNGDGVIGIDEIVGDKNGDGQITLIEIAGDKTGDGIITDPEIAGDINGNGIIDNGEICGDINGNKVIDSNEIAGDISGNGIIDNTETALKTGFRNEIAGDLNGDGIINGNELAGDGNGNGIIDANTELLGDINANNQIGIGEVLGDLNGNGTIDNGEQTVTAIVKKTAIKIYPTSVSNTLLVEIGSKPVSGNIVITNILGSTIREIAFSSQNQIAVNVQSLPAGLYIVKVNAGGIVYSQKIIKE